MNTNFKIIGLARFAIKPESTAAEVGAPSTQLPGLLFFLVVTQCRENHSGGVSLFQTNFEMANRSVDLKSFHFILRFKSMASKSCIK